MTLLGNEDEGSLFSTHTHLYFSTRPGVNRGPPIPTRFFETEQIEWFAQIEKGRSIEKIPR